MLAVFLVVVAVLGAAFVLASRTTSVGTAVEELVVGPDAPFTFVSDPASSTQPPFTNATVAGPAALLALSLPGNVASAKVFDAMSALGLDPAEAQVVRSTITAAGSDGALAPYITMGVITQDGFYDIVGSSPDGRTVWYSPPMLQVPADLSTGSASTNAGLTLDVAPFTSTITVDGPTQVPVDVAGYDGREGCLALSSVLTQEVPDGDGYTTSRRAVWCPGLGAVSSEDLAAGVVTRLAEPADAQWPALADPEPPRMRAAGTSLPFPVPVTVVSRPPLTVPGGMVVVNDAPQDIALVTVAEPREEAFEDTSTLTWLQHPGGSVIGVATSDDRILVTTSQRALQSFDLAGRMRWTAGLPDVASGAPAAFGSVVAVALVDGSLRGFDAVTGSPAWTVRLSDVITQPPVRSGDHVIAADTSGYVVAVDEAGVAQWSYSAGRLDSLSALSDGSVLVGRAGDGLTRLGANGEERWTVSFPDGQLTAPGAIWGDVVVLPTDGGLRGLAVDDGSVLWTRSDLKDLRVTDIGLAVAADRVLRVDPDGSVALVAELPRPDGPVVDVAFLARLGSEWVAVGDTGTITFLGVTDE